MEADLALASGKVGQVALIVVMDRGRWQPAPTAVVLIWLTLGVSAAIFCLALITLLVGEPHGTRLHAVLSYSPAF